MHLQERILVVGGGAMGTGIAWIAARGGYDVAIVEPDATSRDRAKERLERNASRLNDAPLPGRIEWYDRIPEGTGAVAAIEAVPERLDAKRAVFAALAAALPADALLATNTSSLCVEDLAAGVPRPERVLGLHFFNPPEVMKLVEVVRAAQTSDDAIARAYALAERIGKQPVLTADTPGFIVNRVARPYYLQSLRALARGVAQPEEMDELARGAGFRMGPFALMDFIGLDVNLATSESIYERTGAARLEPVELQREMVARGLLGRKSGRGFYDYASSGAPDAKRDAAPNEGDASERNTAERIALLGFGSPADELAERLGQAFAHVQRIENDELLDELSAGTTVVIDTGDGTTDRGTIAAELDSLLDEHAVLFFDAYATDLSACARRMRHPDRLVGYGILGPFAGQRAVEIVDTEEVSDDALALAEELFEALGKQTVLVEDTPGLFLGRVVGSIVNEAMLAVYEEIASPDDVDTAMRLGTNYPIGPIAWGREIGGARVARILRRLAADEGDAFAPHRSLWVLDAEQAQDAEEEGA